MADWANSRDCRDPYLILADKEATDCKLCRCEHFSYVLGERWCDVRNRLNPFNRNCSMFREAK